MFRRRKLEVKIGDVLTTPERECYVKINQYRDGTKILAPLHGYEQPTSHRRGRVVVIDSNFSPEMIRSILESIAGEGL